MNDETSGRAGELVSVLPGVITGLVLLMIGALAFPILQPNSLKDDFERLSGKTYATGFITDGSGGVRASFRATVNGVPQADGIAVLETVQVIGGRSENNRWRLHYGEPFRANEELRVELSRRDGDLVRGVWSLLPNARRDKGDFLAKRRLSNVGLRGASLEVKFSKTPLDDN